MGSMRMTATAGREKTKTAAFFHMQNYCIDMHTYVSYPYRCAIDNL